MKHRIIALTSILLFLLIGFATASGQEGSTTVYLPHIANYAGETIPPPSATPTRAVESTPSPTTTATATPTAAATSTLTPTMTVTSTPTPAATSTLTPTMTVTATPTAAATSTLTPTSTVPPTSTPRPAATSTLTPPTPTPTRTQTPTQAIIIDHRSVALFDQIPEQYLEAARNLDMLFSDRSVGVNVDNYLNCLAASSWAANPVSCRRDYYNSNWDWKSFTQTDYDNGDVPARILFDPDPVRYSRANWTFEYKSGTWSELTEDFIEILAPAYINSKDVLSYQFSYLNVDSGNDIADPATGFFADNANKYDVYDLEAYIAQHPDKTFFFWTTSLARSIGTQVSTDFNNQMRQYARENDKILFDMADIESHTDLGVPCYSNGADPNQPALCRDYTTEVNGGHLGAVSAGGIMTVKAYWVLMARIAGWDGVP